MEIIIVNKITDRQKLTIKNGINTYLYIMNHHKNDDDDFRDVYYNFYLTARSSVFAKYKKNNETKEIKENPNWGLYFNLLRKSDGTESIESIVDTLRKNLSSPSFEFSFASKLLHTKNDSLPIYDSKIHSYLKKSCNKRFKTESEKTLETIKKDWETVVEWYKDFLNTDESKEWIAWFDKEFPEGKTISDIKKIDSIIFACVK